MKCDGCNQDFEESALDESHDVPCYLFEGNRKGRKNQADTLGRHYLCKLCHKEYEDKVRIYMVLTAKKFSLRYWNESYSKEEEIIEEIIESKLEGKKIRDFFIKKMKREIGDDTKTNREL